MTNPLEESKAAVQELEAITKEISKKVFKEWLESPEIKILLSMISPTVNAPPELLLTLLESAFTRGVAAGQTSILGSMMRTFTKYPPPG